MKMWHIAARQIAADFGINFALYYLFCLLYRLNSYPTLQQPTVLRDYTDFHWVISLISTKHPFKQGNRAMLTVNL